MQATMDLTLEQIAENFLHGSSAKFVACHAFGHTFARPGSRRGRSSFGIHRFEDGSRTLSAKCPDCGTIRYRDARPGVRSFFDDGGYRYDWPDGYLPPTGTSEFLPRHVWQDEAIQRWEEELAHPTGGEDFPADMSQLVRAG